MASGKQLFRTLPPDTPPKHLVVYFIPVDAAERCLLLGDHRKSGLWLPPGGHVEDGEDPHQAVIREAREELGIEAEFLDENPLFLTVTRTNQVNSHLDVDLWFVLQVARHGTQLNPDPREFKGIRWFGLDEPQEQRAAGLARRHLRPGDAPLRRQAQGKDRGRYSGNQRLDQPVDLTAIRR